MVDSGARWFCDGKMYFRQLDQLTINIATTRSIDDKDWVAFLEDTLAISRTLGVAAKVTMVCCVYAYPNARQRMAASDFLTRHRLEKMGRVAVVTDSTLMRGAMTAFGWIMPKINISAFRSAEVSGAFQWLHEVGTFDQAQALLAWQDAQTKLGMIPGVSIRPGSV
jgi:SpoIIAA-like